MVGNTGSMSVRKVAVDGIEAVTTDTDQPAGRTFLLVHGIGMGISYFAGLAEVLEQHGRVVALDLPGFGDAPEPAKSAPMADVGKWLIDFVEAEQLGTPILVGHSMGTQIVAEAAAQRPELFPELVLVAPTVNRHERTIRAQARRMMEDLTGESPKVIALGMANYVKTGPRWFVKKLSNMMDHAVEETYPQIRAHTLVIRGSRDVVCPREWVAEVTELIPDAEMVELEGCGHETMIKDPAPVAECILRHVGTLR